jgi:hypothetical protein
MSLPTSVVITEYESPAILQRALEAAGSYKAMGKDEDEIAQLPAGTAPAAGKGEFELYKTTDNFDGKPANTAVVRLKEMIALQLSGHCKPLLPMASSLSGDANLVSMRVARHVRPAASHKKIEVCTLIGLHDVLYIEPQPPAIWKWRRCPLCPARREDFVVDLQAKQSPGNIERYRVS